MTAGQEEIPLLIRRVLEEGPFSIQDLADASGISYNTLYSWAKMRRSPQPASLLKLADGLERRGGHIRELVSDLRRAAGTHSDVDACES